ncbi:MAG: FtsW/RodA/SpoVE family cell cycle protein, partial [Vampirovibrionales bacterium]|nr:FtsW/RodA/SpoVE family cell cycle protein [Vampirovibrionales bacterium]
MRFWPYHPSNQPPRSSPQSQEASEHQRRRVDSHPVAPKNIDSPDLPPIMRFGSPQNSEVSAQRDRKKPKQAIAAQALQAVSDKEPSPVRTKRPPVDAILLTATLVLIAFGLLSVLSASAWEAAGSNGNSFAMVGKQTVFMLLGLLLMRVASLTPLRVWQQWSAKLGIVVAVLIGLTIFVGTTANGSSRWLMLPGGIQFQPSEFAKLSGILLVAQAI